MCPAKLTNNKISVFSFITTLLNEKNRVDIFDIFSDIKTNWNKTVHINVRLLLGKQVSFEFRSIFHFSPRHFHTVSKKEKHFWSTSQLRFQLDASMKACEAIVRLTYLYSPQRINLLLVHAKILVTRVKYLSTKKTVVFLLRALPGGRKRFSRLPEKRTGLSMWGIGTCLLGWVQGQQKLQ